MSDRDISPEDIDQLPIGASDSRNYDDWLDKTGGAAVFMAALGIVVSVASAIWQVLWYVLWHSMFFPAGPRVGDPLWDKQLSYRELILKDLYDPADFHDVTFWSAVGRAWPVWLISALLAAGSCLLYCWLAAAKAKSLREQQVTRSRYEAAARTRLYVVERLQPRTSGRRGADLELAIYAFGDLEQPERIVVVPQSQVVWRPSDDNQPFVSAVFPAAHYDSEGRLQLGAEVVVSSSSNTYRLPEERSGEAELAQRRAHRLQLWRQFEQGRSIANLPMPDQTSE